MRDGDGGEGTDSTREDRRRVLKYGVLALLAGGAGVGVGLRGLDGDPDQTPPATTRTAETPSPTTTDAGEPVDGESTLVERFAPDLYFGRREKWFPTDPRPYTRTSGGRAVVDGVEALAAYSESLRETGAPPAPTVFSHVAPVDTGDDRDVVALQYWLYYPFDQFTVNFHWHDWELLQVFVDRATGDPVLLSASAHARACPNNEYRGPGLSADSRPVVLSEVGSHSSALDTNGRAPSFERRLVDGFDPDVSNGPLSSLESLADVPFAYGLPRDEGGRLPYALPELDGVPLYDHPDLAGVVRGDFVPADVTVRSWADLARPPTDIPLRETGVVLTAPDSTVAGDASYDLVAIEELPDVVDDFTGPQLSFEFAVPGFAEDLYADHITSAGIPWEQARFSDPAADVTDPDHRRLVDGAEPDGLRNRVSGVVELLLGSPDGRLDGVTEGEREALGALVSVSLFGLPVEAACLLRSDPVATATVGGVFRFLHVDPGVHDLVVNAPGVAPYAERFVHEGGTATPGVDGRVTVVANEDAAVVRGDGRDAAGISRVRVVEDFAGAVFDARPVEADRFAVAVHREGAYTVEVTDRDGVHGAVRVVPDGRDEVVVERFATGTASLATALAGSLRDTATLARDLGGGGQSRVPEVFAAAAEDAETAAGLAADGATEEASATLERVRERLDRVRAELSTADRAGYGEAEASVLRRRAAEAIDRTRLAIETARTE